MASLKSAIEAPEFKILSSDTDRSNTTTLASQLTSAVNKAASENASEDEIEGLLWRLWNAIIATASRIPATKQQYLSNLLAEIAAQKSLKSGTGEEIKVWDQTVWRQLPVFGAAVREVFNDDDTDDNDEQRQWVNINAFLARLTVDSASAGADGARDFSLFGIWSLREAFEGKPETSVPQYKVDAAKAWMDIAKTTLAMLSEGEKSYDGRLAAPGAGYLDRNWRGYSEDRLNVWTRRLQKQ